MREGALHPVSLSQYPSQDILLSSSLLFQFFKMTLYYDFIASFQMNMASFIHL